MTKILILSEFSQLSTGYAAYCKELLTTLKDKYEVAELARYISPGDPRLSNVPWKVYPVVPHKDNLQEQEEFKSDQQNMFGKHIFEKVCLDFQPDIVICITDIWMDNWIDLSPFRDKFHWIWMVTADAPNQHEEWLDVYSRCDTLLTYNDWSKDMLIEESRGRLDVMSEAPPSVSPDFKPLDKDSIKKHFGLSDKYIIGTVMRNQKRKMYPDLFKSFRQFLDETKRKDILLYCHTSYPDFGWDIPKLINRYGLSSKTLFSYKCKKCGFFFPSFFADAATFCSKCNEVSAIMSSVKNGLDTKEFSVVYNLFDLYVQYSALEGMGMPPVEAAACGVPVMEVDFSAMKDVVRKLNGTPINTIYKFHEMETGREWGMPDNNDFVKKLKIFFKKPRQLMKTDGFKANAGFKKNYDFNKTVQVWINEIERVVPTLDNKWKKPVNIINTNISVPDQSSNKQYVNFLIKNLLPQMSNTYLELKLIRQLNYGIMSFNPFSSFGDDTSVLGKANNQPFSREDCYQYIMNIVNKHNYWEKVRGQYV